jgi:TRAP-type C4-dicarboxylate transport system substrate-binding protein
MKRCIFLPLGLFAAEHNANRTLLQGQSRALAARRMEILLRSAAPLTPHLKKVARRTMRTASYLGEETVVKTFVLIIALIAAFLTGGQTRALADETNLIFATTEPAGSDDSMHVFTPWAQRLAAATNNAIRIDLREGLAIANSMNIYDRVQSDVVQVGILIPSLIGGKFPLTDVAGLPFVTDDSVNASVAFWRLYKTGALDVEYKDIVPLGIGLFPPQDVQLIKAPPTLDNLNGLRLRVVGKLSSELVQKLGATPLVLDPGDQYTALQRHMIDGVISSWMSMGPLHLNDVTGYHVETSLGTGMFIVFMARQKFNALPATVQQSILDNSGESLSRSLAAGFEARATASRAPAAADPAKHTIVQLSAAQSAAWAKAITPVIDNWTASHPGGAELLANYRRIIAEVKAGK